MMDMRGTVRNFAAALFAGATMIACLPAAASAACDTLSTPLSTPFAQFGDANSYTVVPGGSFEAGAPGWTLTDAGVTAGNETYNVAGGSHSLAIAPEGSAVSPALCISGAQPTLRFFARQTSGSWAVLNVILRWSDATGVVHDTTVGTLQTGSVWTPSPALNLASALPVSQSGQTISVQLVFEPEQYGGAWAIDDAYIDPRMH